MNRTITAVAAAFAILVSPIAATAQQAGKVYRIGILQVNDFSKSPMGPAFVQDLRDLGYVEGQNITFLRRSGGGQRRRLKGNAAELVRLKVDVIVGTSAAVRHAITATRTIPIVVTVAGDFVAQGWAKSLRRPGGNVTGMSTLAQGLVGKQLQLLKETVPSLSRVAIVGVERHGGHAEQVRQAREAAPILGLGLVVIHVEGATDLPTAFQRMRSEGVDGIVVLRHGFLLRLRGQITVLARKAGLPTLFGHRREAQAGGLIAYGADTKALWHGAATYVDKILKGADPAELPISQATNFDLTVNLKTAKALGITVPRSILLRATEVIE